MKTIIVTKPGGPEVLQIVDIEKPKPQASQILIKVYAAAINRADILQRRGKYPPPVGDSPILGLECAGEVVEIGADVNNIKIGDRVFALVGGGAYAEYCIIDAAMAIPMDPNWSYDFATAIPEVFFTANETIFELGQLQTGESILIHAGGSGVGTAAIQMAKHIGAIVYITAGTTEKIEKCLQLGAKAGINHSTDDFEQSILELTAQQGVDVIEDFIGGDYFAKNCRALKIGGRLIQVATMSGQKAEIDLRLLMTKRLQIKGSIMRSRSLEEKCAITARFKQRWLPLLQSGQIKPIIDAVFPFDMVQDAHRYMEANKNFGKIVLQVDCI